MTREIKDLPRIVFFIVVFLVAVSTIWIWLHRAEIADFWSNLFLYYQD